MRKMATAGMTALACTASLSSLLAHHSLANYDTSTPIHLHGVVVRIENANPHSMIFVDHREENGQTTRWALEGPGPVQLARKGFDKLPVQVGMVIKACGYATKERIDRTVGAETGGPPKDTTRMTGRAFNAETLVLTDGSTHPWSDYGQHHCLGKAYKDHHTSLFPTRD